MIKLDKIYTRGGDAGETSLGDGTRIAKHSLRIAAQGEVDETNAAIGLTRCHTMSADIDPLLSRIQNDLFDLGADITRPGNDHKDGNLRIQPAQVKRLEIEIDTANENLEALKSFILRGGTNIAANLHFTCTVCRRAERTMSALNAEEPLNPNGLRYINRLSDLLFVLARQANKNGAADILWAPGEHAKG